LNAFFGHLGASNVAENSKLNKMNALTKLMLASMSIMLMACGPDAGNTPSAPPKTDAGGENKTNENPAHDPERGIGKFQNVTIAPQLNASLAASGEKTFQVKCASCHKLTDEKLVGPGWKGVSERRKAEWILNFMTNTDEMLNKDPAAQAQLEICLVRMPNQSLTDDEAFSLYEFMRKNDGVK